MRSQCEMTETHTPQLQSEPPNPASIVAADQKLLSRFIISRRGRGPVAAATLSWGSYVRRVVEHAGCT